MKLLLWLLLIVMVVLALRKKSRPRQPDVTETVAMPVARSAADAESMVCCAHCQVYLPASEAVMRAQRSYCSSAHADLH